MIFKFIVLSSVLLSGMYAGALEDENKAYNKSKIKEPIMYY